jgi:hypothetical protein
MLSLSFQASVTSSWQSSAKLRWMASQVSSNSDGLDIPKCHSEQVQTAEFLAQAPGWSGPQRRNYLSLRTGLGDRKAAFLTCWELEDTFREQNQMGTYLWQMPTHYFKHTVGMEVFCLLSWSLRQVFPALSIYILFLYLDKAKITQLWFIEIMACIY